MRIVYMTHLIEPEALFGSKLLARRNLLQVDQQARSSRIHLNPVNNNNNNIITIICILSV
jgi:hypothetical protein